MNSYYYYAKLLNNKGTEEHTSDIISIDGALTKDAIRELEEYLLHNANIKKPKVYIISLIKLEK